MTGSPLISPVLHQMLLQFPQSYTQMLRIKVCCYRLSSKNTHSMSKLGIFLGSLDILRLDLMVRVRVGMVCLRSCCIMPTKLLITIEVQGRVCACVCSFIVAMLASISVILSPFCRSFCPRPERTHKAGLRQCVKSS